MNTSLGNFLEHHAVRSCDVLKDMENMSTDYQADRARLGFVLGRAALGDITVPGLTAAEAEKAVEAVNSLIEKLKKEDAQNVVAHFRL